MLLFAVPTGRRVSVTSRTIRWSENRRQESEVVAENVTWTGRTTGAYWFHDGVNRRLVVEHTLGVHGEAGVWQRDIECSVLD